MPFTFTNQTPDAVVIARARKAIRMHPGADKFMVGDLLVRYVTEELSFEQTMAAFDQEYPGSGDQE